MIARTSAIIALSLVQAWLLSQAFASGDNYHSEEFALENAWGEFDGTQQAPTDLSLARLVQIGEGGGKFGLKNKLMKALKSAAAVKKVCVLYRDM